jgi:hypothetical protein
MPQFNHTHMSPGRAQWHHIGYEDVHAHRNANENTAKQPVAETTQKAVSAAGNMTQRSVVLAQILSPTGRVQVDHHVTRHLTCFPQSACWLFKGREEEATL